MDVERLHARARWAAPEGHLHALHGLLVPLQPDFNMAVGKVADPPVHTFDSGPVLSKETEPDALHASADQNAPRNEHGKRELWTVSGCVVHRSLARRGL